MFHAVHVRLNPFIMLSSNHMRSGLPIEHCCSGAVAYLALLYCQRPDHQMCRHDSIRSISISTSFTNVLSWYSVTMGSVPSSRHPCCFLSTSVSRCRNSSHLTLLVRNGGPSREFLSTQKSICSLLAFFALVMEKQNWRQSTRRIRGQAGGRV